MFQRRGYVPPPDKLRHELNIQEQLQERLRQLAKNAIPGKIKSQRGGSVEVFVPHRVKWPHKFILASQNKDRVTLQDHPGGVRYDYKRTHARLCN